MKELHDLLEKLRKCDTERDRLLAEIRTARDSVAADLAAADAALKGRAEDGGRRTEERESDPSSVLNPPPSSLPRNGLAELSPEIATAQFEAELTARRSSVAGAILEQQKPPVVVPRQRKSTPGAQEQANALNYVRPDGGLWNDASLTAAAADLDIPLPSLVVCGRCSAARDVATQPCPGCQGTAYHLAPTLADLKASLDTRMAQIAEQSRDAVHAKRSEAAKKAAATVRERKAAEADLAARRSSLEAGAAELERHLAAVEAEADAELPVIGTDPPHVGTAEYLEDTKRRLGIRETTLTRTEPELAETVTSDDMMDRMSMALKFGNRLTVWPAHHEELERLRSEGATDERILGVLRRQWPNSPCASPVWPDGHLATGTGLYTVQGGKDPGFWPGARPSTTAPAPYTGAALADRVRRCLSIPRPQGRAEDGGRRTEERESGPSSAADLAAALARDARNRNARRRAAAAAERAARGAEPVPAGADRSEKPRQPNRAELEAGRQQPLAQAIAMTGSGWTNPELLAAAKLLGCRPDDVILCDRCNRARSIQTPVCQCGVSQYRFPGAAPRHAEPPKKRKRKEASRAAQ